MRETPPPRRKPPSSPIETATIREVRWLPARRQSPAAADAPEEKVDTQPAPRRMR
jgi:hypothetical protein